MNALLQYFYYDRPDWTDGTTEFDALIRAHIHSHCDVLDLGASTGRSSPANLRIAAKRVIGVDPDPSIAQNKQIDHGVVAVGEHMPFANESFDLVLSDWVVEHLAKPEDVIREVFRVLRPGGWFVFRTGNVFHYSYAIAAATPHWFHQIVGNWARGLHSQTRDPHPTYYRLNRQATLRDCLLRTGFVESQLLMTEKEPSYMSFSRLAIVAGVLYERIVNRFVGLSNLRACIYGSSRKPIDGGNK
jgi:SAM-dependent methyltransferase